MRCLAKLPADRPQLAESLVDALDKGRVPPHSEPTKFEKAVAPSTIGSSSVPSSPAAPSFAPQKTSPTAMVCGFLAVAVLAALMLILR